MLGQPGAARVPSAIIVGGTGQIGLATAELLLDNGWKVTLAHRGSHLMSRSLLERGVNAVIVDRETPGELARTLSSGADLLIDAVAYGPEHARQLSDVQRDVGSMIIVSSSSVYCDSVGRTLDEAAETGFPELPDPISEDQTTVDPGPETYSTRKVALERMLLDEVAAPLTILRPGAISGPGSGHAREWWFVKRIRDGRSIIPVAYRGRSRFHTASAANIAGLCLVCAGLSGQRVLNVGDPAAPTVSEIGKGIAEHFGYAGRILELPDVDAYPPPLGRTPWSVQHPFVLATAAASATGYRPRVLYAETVATICDWLIQATTTKDWRGLFPILASYPFDLFDYASEDKALATVR